MQHDLAFLDGKRKRAEAAALRAVQRLDGVGIGLTLIGSKVTPDITVHPLDIANPHYRICSILSQNADNSLNTLGVHDRMALIRHYPPKQE